jgi:hypothetical protein
LSMGERQKRKFGARREEGLPSNLAVPGAPVNRVAGSRRKPCKVPDPPGKIQPQLTPMSPLKRKIDGGRTRFFPCHAHRFPSSPSASSAVQTLPFVTSQSSRQPRTGRQIIRPSWINRTYFGPPPYRLPAHTSATPARRPPRPRHYRLTAHTSARPRTPSHAALADNPDILRVRPAPTPLPITRTYLAGPPTAPPGRRLPINRTYFRGRRTPRDGPSRHGPTYRLTGHTSGLAADRSPAVHHD